MLSAVVVDDELPGIDLIKILLQQTGQINVSGAFSDSLEALEKINDIKPDVVFLDIEMSGMNGLELANRLIEQNDELMVVFVTGYSQYALQAFKAYALDYILKPVNPSTIQKCVSRLLRLKGLNNEEKPEGSENKIICFGNFEVYGNKGLVKFATRKVEEMLAYFVVNRDANIDGWHLGETLWPEGEPDKVKTNLHTTLYRLRKTIKEEGLQVDILTEKSGNGIYRCSLGQISCDIVEFDRGEIRNSVINKDNIEDVERVCALYRDELFEKKNYEWSEGKREWLQQYYHAMLKNMASFYYNEGLYQNTIDKLLIAAIKAPFDEEIHRKLLMAYTKTKNRGMTIKCHQEFKEKLFKEMGVEPQAETSELFLKLIAE